MASTMEGSVCISMEEEGRHAHTSDNQCEPLVAFKWQGGTTRVTFRNFSTDHMSDTIGRNRQWRTNPKDT